ncbi:MAG: hypothetical protein IK121_04635, partial [Lachnospiraceae bacterium]|nr:hypothetical protein [Lachnospiraceae bacterium]
MNIETCRNENTLPVTSKDTDYVFTKDGITFTVPAIYVRFCHIYVGATNESAMQGNKEPYGTKFAGKTVRYNDKPICYINVRLAQSDELDNYNGFHQNYPLPESYLTHRYPYFRVLSDIAYEVTDERHVYIYDKRMSEFDNLIHRSALLRSIYEYANSYSDLSDLAKDFTDAVYARLSLEEKSALNFNRNNYVKERNDENLLKSAAYDIMCKHMNNEGDFKDLYVDKEFIFKDERIILNPDSVHIYTKDHHTSEAEETFRPNGDKPTEYLWAHEAQAFRNLRFLYQNHCTVFYLH